MPSTTARCRWSTQLSTAPGHASKTHTPTVADQRATKKSAAAPGPPIRFRTNIVCACSETHGISTARPRALPHRKGKTARAGLTRSICTSAESHSHPNASRWHQSAAARRVADCTACFTANNQRQCRTFSPLAMTSNCVFDESGSQMRPSSRGCGTNETFDDSPTMLKAAGRWAAEPTAVAGVVGTVAEGSKQPQRYARVKSDG